MFGTVIACTSPVYHVLYSCVHFFLSISLVLAGDSGEAFTCVPVQGSGTFAVEAVFQTAVPRDNSKVSLFPLCKIEFTPVSTCNTNSQSDQHLY